MEIKADTAENVWKIVLKKVYLEGLDFQDRDGRKCREILNIITTIKDLTTIKKPIETINSFGKWVYPSLEELKEVVLNKNEVPGYYYNYGARAFNFEGKNQIDEYIIPLLKKDNESRRGTIVFYNPKKDSFPFKKDIPSVIMINFNMRKGRLNTTAVVRSSDLFFGWPANIYQTYIIQKYITEALKCNLGELTIYSVSAHIFEDQFEFIKKII